LKVIEILDMSDPDAVAGEDRTVPAGKLVTFDGSGSTDDGTIIKYKWTFTEDFVPRELTGIEATYIFTVPGTYEITLFVQDAALNYAEDTVIITVVGTGTLTGTVVDENGDPIDGAEIFVLCSDGITYTGISDQDGSFSIDVYYGNTTWTIKSSGYKDRTGTAYVEAMGSSSLPSSETALKKEKERSGIFLIVIIAVIVLILVIGLVSFLITRSKKKPEVEEEPTLDQDEEQTELGEDLLNETDQAEGLPDPGSVVDEDLQLPPHEEPILTTTEDISEHPDDEIAYQDEISPGEEI
jgi:PKD repeat protein